MQTEATLRAAYNNAARAGDWVAARIIADQLAPFIDAELTNMGPVDL